MLPPRGFAIVYRTTPDSSLEVQLHAFLANYSGVFDTLTGGPRQAIAIATDADTLLRFWLRTGNVALVSPAGTVVDEIGPAVGNRSWHEGVVAYRESYTGAPFPNHDKVVSADWHKVTTSGEPPIPLKAAQAAARMGIVMDAARFDNWSMLGRYSHCRSFSLRRAARPRPPRAPPAHRRRPASSHRCPPILPLVLVCGRTRLDSPCAPSTRLPSTPSAPTARGRNCGLH